MTAQINDRVFHHKFAFNIAGISGNSLFDPGLHGIKPKAISSACWRGYHILYAIEDNQLWLKQVTVGLSYLEKVAARHGRGPLLLGKHPHSDERELEWVYDGFHELIPFTGGLLLGAQFIRELYVHMGFHPAWKYRDVREVLFEKGMVIDDRDISDTMAEVRAKLSAEPLKPGADDRFACVQEWVGKCFSRDYTRKYEQTDSNTAI